MAKIVGPIRPMLILPMVLIVLLTHAPNTMAAAPADTAPDRLELVRLAAVAPAPGSPPGSMRFEAQLNYTLSSTPAGYLGLFAFEDDAQRSSQHSSDPIPVKAGSGRATVDIEYVPGKQVQRLTLIAGLFTQDERLLGWVATNPMSLSTWAARIQFQQAMAARMDGDHARAADYLTEAIQASPDSGNLYYWRADTRVRLGQYDEAIEDYNKALEMMPQHRASMVGRAVALLWKGEWTEASDDLTAELEMDVEPDEVTGWAHRARGIANAALGKVAEAIGDYEAYLAISPGAADKDEVQGWIAQLRAVAGSGG
jgi:tetratricopeptide (TPR) repeat protein